MSRWLSNVGNFLDQLDTKAAVVVNSAVSGRQVDDDDDDDDDENCDGYYESDITNTNLESLLYQPTNTTSGSTAPSSTEEFFHDASASAEGVVDDVDEFLEENVRGRQPKAHPPSKSHNEKDHREALHLNAVGNVDTSVNTQMEIEDEGWKNDDDIDDTTERSNFSISATKENKNEHYETPAIVTNKIDAASDSDALLERETESHHVETSTHVRSDDVFAEMNPDNDSGRLLEQIASLEQELQQCQSRFQQMQQERQNELIVVTKEARTLRRHLATMNEQLAAADREVGAQRQELENAAQRIEKDRLKCKQDVQALQTKQNTEVQQMKQAHLDALAVVQAQAQNQIEIMKQELSKIHQQRQQEGGDWNMELADALRREQIVREECQSLVDEKETLIEQIEALRSQQESLGSRLESLTVIADNAAIHEREAEVQLDNAMSIHAKQISQRQSREAELERTVSELSSQLVVERSKNTNMIMSIGNEVTPSVSQESGMMMDLERMKSQLEMERQQNISLRKDIDDIVHERQEETILTQTRQLQHEKKVSELTQQLLELRATIRDVMQQDSSLQQQRQSDATKFDTQRIQDLSEELICMRERISVSNSEAAALRNRLQAALNRAIVAEAAAESAYTTSEHNSTWSNSNSNDLEQGLSVRRRGANHRSTYNNKQSADTPTMRKALQLDSLQGNGNESSTQRIGKGLDILDSFLAQSGEILRFNPIARLCFVVYLLLLHIWTFALLMFHAHGFDTLHANGDSGLTQPHGPGALLQQQAAIVNVSNGN